MEKEITDIQDILETTKGAHICYYVHELERYIDNAVAYIIAGIEQGDQVLFVENERLYPKILKRVEELVPKDQLRNIHYVNNFTFYWRNGNFHPPTILAYFSEWITPFMKDELSFRTWGHIEWRDEVEIIKDIQEYECAINMLIPQTKAISVCAYDASRVSAPLKKVLLDCHGFLMTDDNIAPISKQID